jgi:hypothetical protein
LDKTQIKASPKPGATSKAQPKPASEATPSHLKERDLLDNAGEVAFEMLAAQME